MDGLSTAVYQCRNRKLQFPDDGILLFQIIIIGFHQRIPVFRHIVILDAFAIQWVKPDPRTGSFLVVSDHRSDIPIAPVQQLYQLPGRPVITSFGRKIFPVLFPCFCYISDII